MKLWIENVLSLQALDMKLRNLEAKRTAIPLEKARLNAEYKAETAKLNQVREQKLRLDRALKELEGKEAQTDEMIRKLLTQSAMVKKNNEYQAMMADIEAKKQIRSELETQQLELMDKIEQAENTLKKAEHDFAVYDRSIRADAKDLIALEKAVKEEIRTTTSLRDLHREKVDPAVLEIYTRLLASGKDEPMGKLLEGNVCSNCRIHVTQQTVFDVKKGNVTQCSNCSHLLYQVPEDASQE